MEREVWALLTTWPPDFLKSMDPWTPVPRLAGLCPRG